MKFHQMEMACTTLVRSPQRNQLFPNLLDDFSEVARSVPSKTIAHGLAAALRADQSASFGRKVAELFVHSNAELRVRTLNLLLENSSKPTQSSWASAGLFGLVPCMRQIESETAMHIAPEAISVLAEESEQCDPDVVDRISALYAQHPAIVRALGARAISIIMTHIAKDR
jgi:hypothetical protein